MTLCFILVASLGCTAANQDEPEKNKESKATTIMQDFQSLSQQEATLEEIANFINNNISQVAKEDASTMVNEFEEMQKEQLAQFEAMFSPDAMQTKLAEEYPAIAKQEAVKDPELKALLDKTNNSGYKVETAEGSFFPIIDYQFYEKFSAYVTTDSQDYIHIMAVESKQVPAKDAALVIGWDEILQRAQNQEKFLITHKNSVKANEIKNLYQKYVTFTLYGANNTPLFSYETNTLNPKAKEIYLAASKNPGNSEYLKMLSLYLEVLAKNNFVLTEEVKQYRDQISK
ncbi:hypothetical protein [Desulforamulus aeronauticus]|uniref:Uncharacterized protein n=1 Tax=Desulforamulus aeronauticus DSM 10349 TaxID=1121421 RepID=A0A1M6RL45_9FIRM|nr:hypothetical protein [Desulforamulus aeronauticus]SHK33149.1 hypothetical protein SAMN02745123_01504 [Desulforamulus aeronauticus DSM 10349]